SLLARNRSCRGGASSHGGRSLSPPAPHPGAHRAGWRGATGRDQSRGVELEKAAQAAPGRVIPTYVFDTGALIAAERGKERASRFFRLVQIGRAHVAIPLPVVAEWWRGRTDAREEILGASRVVATLEIAKAAGVALARVKDVEQDLTIDAI